MSLWIALAAMSLLATLFIALPLYRHQQKLSALTVAAIIVVVAGSAGLYARQGSPHLPSVPGGSGEDGLASLAEVVDALAERLEREPADLQGWKMLGRSYMNMQEYAGAVDAFERANAIESSSNAETLVELGEALLARDNAQVSGRIANLFEAALTLDPNNPKGLFYGGIGANNNGNNELAAERWERLLVQNPPPEIQQVLEQRIAEWRGEAPPVQAPAPAAEAKPPADDSEAIVSATISVSPEAAADLPANALVFVIARDPSAPSPPIAVVRQQLAGLPAVVQLDDSHSMMAGRSLSGFEEFELIARVSLSGAPAQQSGDWFGTVLVRPADAPRVELAINQQAP